MSILYTFPLLLSDFLSWSRIYSVTVSTKVNYWNLHLKRLCMLLAWVFMFIWRLHDSIILRINPSLLIDVVSAASAVHFTYHLHWCVTCSKANCSASIDRCCDHMTSCTKSFYTFAETAADISQILNLDAEEATPLTNKCDCSCHQNGDFVKLLQNEVQQLRTELMHSQQTISSLKQNELILRQRWHSLRLKWILKFVYVAQLASGSKSSWIL